MFNYLQAHTQTISRCGKNVVIALSTLLDNYCTNQRGVPISTTNTRLLHMYTCYISHYNKQPHYCVALPSHTVGKFSPREKFSSSALIAKTFYPCNGDISLILCEVHVAVWTWQIFVQRNISAISTSQ